MRSSLTPKISRQLAAYGLLLGLVTACDSNPMTNLPPIQASGSVGNTFRTREVADQPREFINQVSGTANASSYIWQPWFATARAGATVGYEKGTGGTTESDSLVVSGDVNLSILPLSRYPATISYSRTDSRAEGALGADFVRDRVAVTSQAAITDDIRTFTTLGYQNIEQPELGQQESRNGTFTITKNFQKASLSLSLEHEHSDFESEIESEEDEREDTNVLTLRGTYRPNEELSSQTTTTFLQNSEDAETQKRERLLIQGISTAQWRPKELPFTMNGALRTLRDSIKFSGSSATSDDQDTLLASGTVGLNYPISPRLTANFGFNGTYETSDTGGGSDTGESVTGNRDFIEGRVLGSINYLSPREPFAGFDWSWNANATLQPFFRDGSGSEKEGVNIDGSTTLGHSVSRDLEIPWLGQGLFNASQSLRTSRADAEEIVPNLSHNASLTYSDSEAGTSTFVRLGVSDSRDLIAQQPTEFSLIQLQLNKQSNLDLSNQWRGGLSLQVSRRKFGDESADIITTANGRLGYFSREVFSVENLDFLSELSLNAIGLEDVLGDEDDDDRFRSEVRGDWTNRLEYRIGKITASLEGTVFVVDDQFGNSVIFRIRRDFGGVF